MTRGKEIKNSEYLFTVPKRKSWWKELWLFFKDEIL